MYLLINTFAQPEYTISRHCTLVAAVKAEAKHGRDVRRNNGASSYIPTTIGVDGKTPQFSARELDHARDVAARGLS